MRRSPTAPLLLAVLLLAPLAGAAEPRPLTLELSDTFALSDASLLLGHLTLDEPRLRDPGATAIQGLIAPQGELVVCPVEGGPRGEVPPLPVLEQRCRNEESWEDPRFSFGARTWIRFTGNHTLQRAPNASMSLFVPGANGTLWGALGSPDGMVLGLDDDRFIFRPLISSSEVTVHAEGEQRQYNGTDWAFYFQGTGSMMLASEGTYALAPVTLDLTLTSARLEPLREVLEPRRLLDLQDAVLGADAREPVRNATTLFEDHGRVPHLVNGAFLGHLNGTLGDRALDPEDVTLVRTGSWQGTLEGTLLAGTGGVHFTQSQVGFAPQGEDPASVPWWLVGLLWLGAGVALVVRDPPEPDHAPAWLGALGAGVAALAVLVWDARFGSITGTSVTGLGGTSVLGSGQLGVILALIGFEALALLLAAGLLFLPVRLAAGRLVPEDVRPFTGPGAGALLVGYLLLWPGTVIALGLLVARL